MDKENTTIKTASLEVILDLYRTKGSLQIDEDGYVISRSQHQTIWAKVDKEVIPAPIMSFDNIIIPTKNRESKTGTASAFFKFCKNDFQIYAETLGMRIASLFPGTKTCYNCPAILNKNSPTIQKALTKVNDINNGKGMLVYSLLDKNEYLYTIMDASKVETPVSLVEENFKTIQKFINEKRTDLDLRSRIGLGFDLKKDFSYQWLFRDCFGDVDFTSRNAGLIHNTETNEVRLAPQFDFGEILNILYKNKFCEPTLDKIENYAGLPNQEKWQSLVNRVNATKMAKHNASPKELAQLDTTDTTQANITYLTTKQPDVVCSFLKDLNYFNEAQYITVLVPEYTDNFNLISREQADLVTQFIQARMDCFSKNLVEGLQQNSPEFFDNYLQENPDLLPLVQKIEQQENAENLSNTSTPPEQE